MLCAPLRANDLRNRASWQHVLAALEAMHSDQQRNTYNPPYAPAISIWQMFRMSCSDGAESSNSTP